MRTVLTLTASALAGAFLLTAAASTTEASAPQPRLTSAAGTYGVDLGHSNILFKCKHLGVSYQWGRFDKFDGQFILGEDAASSNVSIAVEATSVNSNSKDRDDHLRGPDFFDVKQFPEMTFASTKVTKGEGDAYTVVGDLTLHGVTKEVTMDVTKVGEADTGRMGKRAGFEGTFSIDRMDYGIKSYPDMLGSDVMMTFAIEGIMK